MSYLGPCHTCMMVVLFENSQRLLVCNSFLSRVFNTPLDSMYCIVPIAKFFIQPDVTSLQVVRNVKESVKLSIAGKLLNFCLQKYIELLIRLMKNYPKSKSRIPKQIAFALAESHFVEESSQKFSI